MVLKGRMSRLSITTFLAFSLGVCTAMGQDDQQKQIDQLQKDTEELTAKKANVDAQKALLDSQKALSDAQSQAASAKDTALEELKKEKEKLDAEKAQIDAEKAVVDSKKALLDSQSQAVLAKYIGDVKTGPYSGTVTMENKAGTEEAALLAARAVNEAAAKVVEAVEGNGTKFYVFAASQFPNFQRLLSFRFRKELVKQAFASAGVSRPAETEAFVPPPELASAGLDAFAKLIGFFKTDFTLGGAEVNLDESLLLFSVAGGLSKKSKEAHLPIIYEPSAQQKAVAALTGELAELVDLRARASNNVKDLQNKIADNEKKASNPANTSIKDSLLRDNAQLKAKEAQLNGVIALYDSFAGALTTPDANGILPISTVAQESAIDSALKGGGLVLILRLESSGGGYLVKKNLWTGLGRMPLFHMGGATVTYVLLQGTDGRVLAGGVVPDHGGFVRTDKIRDALSK